MSVFIMISLFVIAIPFDQLQVKGGLRRLPLVLQLSSMAMEVTKPVKWLRPCF